jgi:hypothetical protein
MTPRRHIALLTAALLLGAAQPAFAGKERIDLAAGADEAVLAQDQEAQRRAAPGRAPRDAQQPTPTDNPGAIPPPQPATPREFIPVPDRWRLSDAIGVQNEIGDPYKQNWLKGDRPVFGKDWFVNFSMISDTVIEPRRVPTPVPFASSARDLANDQFSKSSQFLVNQSLIASFSLIKGNTAFKPPDFELRFTPVFNFNRTQVDEIGLLDANPAKGKTRNDSHLGVSEAFADYHIHNVSERYDFDSVRVGIQPFSTDFRGFLFQDSQLGIRLFGDRFNNKIQYNLAWFRKLDKDTNSGINDVTRRVRKDDIFVANVYLQDLFTLGYTPQFTVVHNRNREDDRFFYDDNDFLQRPAPIGDQRTRRYNVTYIGYNGDGHFGRVNLTHAIYGALGTDRHNQFTGREADIRAYFAAFEPSIDFDWIRVRGSFLYASGDKDPNNDTETGFSAIFENPQFAGADTSYWIRQGIPFIGGGNVALTQRNGVLAELRSSKEHGQSNFNNPGIMLIGGGADFDILPELRFSTNVNYLRFADTASLEYLRNQGEISNSIGWDISGAATYRPFNNQNVVFRLSGAVLLPGQGLKRLYSVDDADQSILYSVLANLILTY